MKLYADKEMKKPIYFVPFGEVQIGASKEMVVFVHNESLNTIKDLEFFVHVPEVELLSGPRVLEGKGVESLTVKWTPSVTVKRGLNVDIDWEGVEVYGQ